MLLLQLNRNFLDSHICHGFTMLNTWGSNLKYSGLIKLNKGTERDVMEVWMVLRGLWLYFRNTKMLQMHLFLEEMLAKKTSVACVERSFARWWVVLLFWHSVLCCRIWLAGYAVFFRIRIILQGCFNWVNQMMLKDTNFTGSGKSAGSVHLPIATPEREVSSRLLVRLSWLEIQDSPQEFFPKESSVKLLTFQLNVKQVGKIKTF